MGTRRLESSPGVGLEPSRLVETKARLGSRKLETSSRRLEPFCFVSGIISAVKSRTQYVYQQLCETFL
jgi:hypothetical protein